MATIYRKVRSAGKLALQQAVKRLLISSISRSTLNHLYLQIPPFLHTATYNYFAKQFRRGDIPRIEGSWTVKVSGTTVKLPLRAQNIIIDWDLALSLMGHDTQIKSTYLKIIKSSMRPQLFIDIGANYGTHSLLFLSQGIETLTFEPNVNCHSFFLESCKLNGFTPQLEGVALGNSTSQIDLWFPEDETWLGSVNLTVKSRLEEGHNLISQRVDLRTLDSYLEQIGKRKILIKIDTEGNEYEVLKGSKRVLSTLRPIVIIETFPGKSREDVFDFLASHKYAFFDLPYDPSSDAPPLDRQEFLSRKSDNFIACPQT